MATNTAPNKFQAGDSINWKGEPAAILEVHLQERCYTIQCANGTHVLEFSDQGLWSKTNEIKVRYSNQRAEIERLLAMPDEWPANERTKWIRNVYGTGAYLGQDSDGAYHISVRV